MKILLFFLAVPCLVVSADIQCPDGKLSCPPGKVCCSVDGEYECCDPESEPQGKRKVFTGLEAALGYGSLNTTDANIQNSYCNFVSCPSWQPCCYNTFCCPATNGYCCSSQQCCQNGFRCCPFSQNCCPVGTQCCGSGASQWCCKNRARCGYSYNTCFGAGVTFTPAIATLAVLFFVTLSSKKYLE